MSYSPSDQPPGQGPRTGGTVVNEGGGPATPASPNYASAGVPGVAVQLPGRPADPSSAPPTGQPPHPGQPAQPAPAPAAQPAPPVQAQNRPPSQPQGMPSAPASNDDQLMTGGKRTIYEFTGEHSEENRGGGRHKTFFADEAELSMADAGSPERDTNLKGGSMGWVIGVIVLLIAGGIFGALSLFSRPGAETEPETPGMNAADQAEPPAEAAPAAAPAETGEAAADTGETGEVAADADADEAAKAKAEEEAKAKAEAEAKAEEEAKAKAEAEAKKKASSSSPKKKRPPKKKKKPSGSGSGSGSGSSSKKPISITPSGGPREPKKFGGLPEP